MTDKNNLLFSCQILLASHAFHFSRLCEGFVFFPLAAWPLLTAVSPSPLTSLTQICALVKDIVGFEGFFCVKHNCVSYSL